MITIRLPNEIEKRLENLAQETGRTKTYYIKEAILEKIEDMEDRYLAIQRLEFPMKSLTIEEARHELGLDS